MRPAAYARYIAARTLAWVCGVYAVAIAAGWIS